MGSKCATVEKTDDWKNRLVCCTVQRKPEDPSGASKLIAVKDASDESTEASRGSSKGASRRGPSSPKDSGSGSRSPSPPAEDDSADPKKSKLVLKNALAKVRGALQSTVDDLKKFREFLRPLYASPAEAFKDMSGGRDEVDKALFVKKLGEMGFTGNAYRVFQALVDGDDHLTLKSFKAGLKPQSKKATGIMEAVRAAKEAAASGGAAEDAGRQMAKELQTFREFVEPLFPSTKEAFNYFSRDTDNIDFATFAGQLRMIHYTMGEPEALFNLLADKQGKLGKGLFLERFETPLEAADQDSRRSQRTFNDSQRRRSIPPAAPPVVTKSRSTASVVKRPSPKGGDAGSRVRAGSEPRVRAGASPTRAAAVEPAAADAALRSRPPRGPSERPSEAPARPQRTRRAASAAP